MSLLNRSGAAHLRSGLAVLVLHHATSRAFTPWDEDSLAIHAVHQDGAYR